jgi:hypothetical protein
LAALLTTLLLARLLTTALLLLAGLLVRLVLLVLVRHLVTSPVERADNCRPAHTFRFQTGSLSA